MLMWRIGVVVISSEFGCVCVCVSYEHIQSQCSILSFKINESVEHFSSWPLHGGLDGFVFESEACQSGPISAVSEMSACLSDASA